MGRFLDMIRNGAADNVEAHKLYASAKQAKEAKQVHSVSSDSDYVTRETHLTSEDSWEWIEERAAIMEIDGGLDRDTANYRAFMMWFERFVGRSAQIGNAHERESPDIQQTSPETIS